jgi:hypothetical protein
VLGKHAWHDLRHPPGIAHQNVAQAFPATSAGKA